jgi:hypothetical protein
MSFCEGDICGNWICLDGAQEHDSCELDFAGENITEKYRLVSKKQEKISKIKKIISDIFNYFLAPKLTLSRGKKIRNKIKNV